MMYRQHGLASGRRRFDETLRKAHAEYRARVGILHTDAPAVSLDGEAAECEAEPAAAARQDFFGRALHEAVKDVVALLGGNAWPAIGDTNLDAVSQTSRRNHYRGLGGRVSQGVVDKVLDHPPQQVFVGDHAVDLQVSSQRDVPILGAY